MEKYDIKRYIFPYLQSNMYILAEKEKALVIDPHYSEDAYAYLKGHNVQEVLVIFTHEHFDHTSGIDWFKENFNMRLVCQKEAMNKKRQKYCNRPIVACMNLIDEGKKEEAEKLDAMFPQYTYEADILFEDEISMEWNGFKLHFEHLPGHSPASCMICIDGKLIFTGDSLIPGISTIVRWPWSSPSDYQEISINKLLRIPPESIIYPGHGECVSMGKLRYNGEMFCVE